MGPKSISLSEIREKIKPPMDFLSEKTQQN